MPDRAREWGAHSHRACQAAHRAPVDAQWYDSLVIPKFTLPPAMSDCGLEQRAAWSSVRLDEAARRLPETAGSSATACTKAPAVPLAGAFAFPPCHLIPRHAAGRSSPPAGGAGSGAGLGSAAARGVAAMLLALCHAARSSPSFMNR